MIYTHTADANTPPAITGSSTDLKTIFAAKVADGGDGFLTSAIGDATSALTDTEVAAADLVAISDATSGTLNINTATKITGLLADINDVLGDGTISNKGQRL